MYLDIFDVRLEELLPLLEVVILVYNIDIFYRFQKVLNFGERSTCFSWFFLDIQSVWVVPTCDDNCDGVLVYPK